MPQNLTAFYRDFVAQSKPCIIKNAFNDWPALKHWDIDYLHKKAGHLEISADLTPSGHGDCVAPAPDYCADSTYDTPQSVPAGGLYDPATCFVKPHQSRITFAHFLDELRKHQTKVRNDDPTADDDEVYYLQHQNDSFRKEFVQVLGEDLDKSIEKFGTELFGCAPDAINFWAGDSRAVSSMHKDHYENLYCVVRGTKRFTLLPPTDLPWLNQKWFREANYERNSDGKLVPKLQEPETAIPWIPIDPDMPEEERWQKHKRAALISPLHVEVNEGEMLYLPALVYHKVAQIGDGIEGKVLAINYWWDMQFGTSYTYYKMVEAAVAQRDTREASAAKKASSASHTGSKSSNSSTTSSAASHAPSAPTDPSSSTTSSSSSELSKQQDVVFVGNLSFTVDEAELKLFMQMFGEIDSINFMQRGGRPLGFAFVKYKELASVATAVAASGTDLMGRPIVIKAASPTDEKP